jgi:TonB family protein
MSPLSLLFSSDEETSRALAQALHELEFEVECCPEIFGAVEKLTSRSYDVIVSDWDEGPEAAFLLQTSRELRSNKAAFALAIATPEATAAARWAGAHLVLSKPIVPEKAKYALLTCDEFLAHMKAWLSSQDSPAAHRSRLQTTPARSWPAAQRQQPVPEPLAVQPARPSPLPGHSRDSDIPSVVPPFAFADGLFQPMVGRPVIETGELSRDTRAMPRERPSGTMLRVAAIALTFLSVSYLFSEPLRSEAVAASVASICGRALERTQAWFHGPTKVEEAAAPIALQPETQPVSRYPDFTTIRVNASHLAKAIAPAIGAPRFLQNDAQPPRPSWPPATIQASIPDSLRNPIPKGNLRTLSKFGPSLLAALEPVSLPEELSEKLLLQKVQPRYPEQALRAGMQGPVVLQAWIGTDGTIRDLKLIRGSLLLGEAAYHAVKQWRYQPYVVNGRAVEAQTLVTVDFRLP